MSYKTALLTKAKTYKLANPHYQEHGQTHHGVFTH